MRQRIISLLVAVAFAVGGVALPATAASAHSKDDRVRLACVNPAGKEPPGQQPICKGKAHHQVKKFDDKRDDHKRDHKADNRKHHKRDHKADNRKRDKRKHDQCKRDHDKKHHDKKHHDKRFPHKMRLANLV